LLGGVRDEVRSTESRTRDPGRVAARLRIFRHAVGTRSLNEVASREAALRFLADAPEKMNAGWRIK
jgi:hypothetical protein